MTRWSPVLAVILAAIGLIVWIVLHQGLSDATLGGLLGALIGAAAILSGVLIDRWQRRADDSRATAERHQKLKALITAELVSVAAGLMDADRVVGAAVRAVEFGQAGMSADLADYVTRPMPFTSNLGVELLVLSQREIDVLATLRASLSQTETLMTKNQSLTFIVSKAIQDGIRHDMRILAEVFDEFAPERKFALGGGAPEPVSALLRRLAADATAPHSAK